MDMPTSRTVADLMDEMAERYPEQAFIVCGDERLTYAQFRERTRELAKGLYQLGIRNGDHVALLMGNQTEFLLALFAVGLLGGTTVTLNTWYKAHELNYVLNHSDAKMVIMADRFLSQNYVDILSELNVPGDGIPAIANVICVSDQRYPGLLDYRDVVAGASGIGDAELDAIQAEVNPEDIAFLLYTSGTTAFPKGAQLQHFALVENMWHIGERLHLVPGDRLWLGVTLFWGFACENALFAMMTHAGCLVLQHHFEPGEAMRLIEQERCTVYYGMPNMTTAILEHPDFAKRELSSLRTGITLGTPDVMRPACDGLGVTQICQCYGLTEVYGNCALNDAHDPQAVRCDTVGKALPGTEMVIADPETHEPLPNGELGEIKIQGYVMPGYYKAEDKNREAFDQDGYFLSGDIGWKDEQGYFHFHSRLKGMIKSGGINIAPAEVEMYLMKQPGISNVAVVGVPDPVKTEVLAACIVPKPGADLDAVAIQAACKANLASYKVPHYLRFITPDDLTMTPTGKVQKVKLKETMAAWIARAAGQEAGDGV